MTVKGDLVRQDPLQLNKIEGPASLELRTKATEAAIETVRDVINVLVLYGKAAVEDRAKWGETQRRITELDARTRSQLEKLEAQLMNAKEKTKRLGMVLAVVREQADKLPEPLAVGLGKAVENLTKDL